ncbi:S8 family serine peptidase [Homoserinibacter sp. GY 40078]|uniref:S8 family serine peptidase n=1 Tax=Homoserinibacter sp. GY 40078 TaxID=2603275 RepID=UPI0011C94B45|nr:S8 family serine peptidase [Homoserinibacter sp. GY 40078]TXK17515.1 S8 family serine peptidase [Homoserinibacter sp. GY 40078]
MRSRGFVLATVLTASALAAGLVVTPAYAADPRDFTAAPLVAADPPQDSARTVSGQLAESDAKLLARSDATLVPIMVKVDVDPVASYAGGLEGFAATSPEVTGRQLSLKDPAVARYLEHVKAVLAKTQADITSRISSASTLSTFPVAYGGLAMMVRARDAKSVLAVPGVAAVQQNSLRHLPTSDTGSSSSWGASVSTAATGSHGSSGLDNDASTFIGADAVWPSLGGRDKAGKGVIVGVIDSGIWPEHPMLVDNGIPHPAGGPWACDFGEGGDPSFTCNDKLVGAYAFLDTYAALNEVGTEDFCSDAGCSARDSDGHGTHTATTAAGSYVASAPIFGVDRGPVSGIAPGASIIAYRALGPEGGYTSDLLAAVQQTILDGVDVINYSVSGSGSVYTDAVELAFLDAYAAGITVNASAGNDGPGASTANHAGPWVTTVAASTFDRAFSSTLTLTAADGATFTKSGATLTQGVDDAPVVLAQNVPGYTGGATCLTPFTAGSLTGLVVLCQRGTNGRVEKGYNAVQGGAAGMVLYNPTASDVETDNHFLPAIHLEGPNDEMLAFLGAHSDVSATWAAGAPTRAQGDVMAGFSSRGPIGEFLKPDVTAPGVQILAGHTPASTDLATGPQGELYQAIAGTSMSSPHAAGVSTLVIAAHPSWKPGQVKSALMTSSLQDVVNADGSDAGVFDRGSGSIRANRAISPTLTISESAADFAASAANPLGRHDLNIPSVYIDPLPGAAVVTRTLTNVSGRTQTFSTRTSAEGGVKIIVTPSKFTIPAGKSRTVKIVLSGVDASEGWNEGSITFRPTRSGVTPVVMPVAVNVGEADISLAQSCAPTEITRGAASTCTVTASSGLPVDVQAKIDVVASPLLKVTSVTAPATKKPLGATWTGTLSAALPPTVDAVDAVDPASTPGGGFLPLSDFGITPVAGVGDESIVNFTVPSFVFGGEVYDSIGIVSNGYLVVGGGTSGDVEYTPPASFPDPATPNNVLAPFWTDLNPDAGGALRVATLSDGVDDYLVAEWQDVPSWSDGGTNSFQVWILLGATESTWFTYGGPLTPDSSVGSLTGAENRTGTSGVTVDPVDPDQAYTVLTSPPQAGGAVTFDYTVKGLLRGTHSTVATLRSDALDTVPIERTRIRVK